MKKMICSSGRLILLSMLTLNYSIGQSAGNMKNDEITLEAIRQVVGDYFQGTTNGDMEALKRAFHEDCKIYSINDQDQLTYLDQPAFRQVVMDNFKTFRRKNQILTIDISGNTASVKTRADYPPFAFLDYLTLLQIEGNWKIVSKSTYQLKKE